MDSTAHAACKIYVFYKFCFHQHKTYVEQLNSNKKRKSSHQLAGYQHLI